jgi:molybdopterin molybdotransferase
VKPAGLLDLDEALAQLLAQAQPVDEVDGVDTLEACGRVLASDQTSALDMPPMANAQMDGYAIRIADAAAALATSPAASAAASPAASAAAAPAPLRVAQRIPAGHVGTELAPGTAARVFTGAMLPPGADAVVMQEEADAVGDAVALRRVPAPGEWIRRAGEDIRAGSVVLPAGTLLTPQATGLLASVGLASVPVRRRVRVACFFTGDELAMPGEPLKPGAIYNSNRFVLNGLLRALDCEVTDLGIVGDTLAKTRDALRRAAADADLIVTSGGMSVGEEDHVKPAVEAEGELRMWQVAMKPGKPLAYGRVRRAVDAALFVRSPVHAHFIGLPGNPVSSFVTFLLLVSPFVRRLQGRADVAPRALPMRADFDWPRPDRRREFLRVRVNEAGGLDLFPNQGSGVLTSTAWADGLADNPASQPIRRGDTVRFLPYSALMP